MLLESLIYHTLLSFSILTSAFPSRFTHKCATRDFNASFNKDKSHETSVNHLKSSKNAKLLSMQDPPKNITIKVYWHILQMLSLTQTSSYYESIQETMAVLNSDFIGSDFQFIIEYISHTPQTLILDIDVLESIKSEERVGKATLLNIYSGDLANSVLGHSTFPQDYKLAPFKDGVLIANKALARSKSTQYIGRTLTHEVGHWLGLYHTFSEGCSFPNDFVSDTRPQAQETSGCPVNRKSCDHTHFSLEDRPFYWKVDAIHPFDMVHNFMDYSDDSCMRSFTSGQIERMKVHWLMREMYDY